MRPGVLLAAWFSADSPDVHTDDDGGAAAGPRLDVVDEGVAVDVRHHEVDDEHTVVLDVEPGDGVRAVAGAVDGMPCSLDDFGDQRSDRRLVIHHQHTSVRAHGGVLKQ